MMTIALFFLPLVTAIANRLWRGEGMVPRWVWYSYMIFCGTSVYYMGHPETAGAHLTLIGCAWAVYLLGYAVPPSQALFSAIHGRAPSRGDRPIWQWMQHAAYEIAACVRPYRFDQTEVVYHTFGVIYGTIRSLWMLPGVAMLCYATGSPLPAAGLVSMLLGLLYYGAGRLSRHFEQGEVMGVPLAELGAGWWIGSYMLIVGVV